ncbi:MAG: inositol monophosphatase family protein [Betaproteobacteria bacterium]
MIDLAARAAVARTLAREAGALGRRYFQRELAFSPQAKGPQDWVSAADLAVEDLIRGELARVFPDDAMLGEEAGISGSGVGDALWAVDPIDGTINFIHGVRYWCVSIAFTVGGVARIGAVYDPSADELFWAVEGGGAWRDDEPIAVSDCRALDRALVAAGYVPRHPLAESLALRAQLLGAGAAVKDMGAGALMLAHVAAGRFDAFLEPHMHPWDALAGLLLVREAGGRTLPYPGHAGLAAGGPVIAAGPGVFDALAALPGAPRR